MEVEKLLKLSLEYISDYWAAFHTTLTNPKLEFQPTALLAENNPVIISTYNSKPVRERLNPKLLTFLLISIFIGSVFNINIQGRGPAPEFVITTVIVTAHWLLFGCLIHVVCKAFGGRASFIQALSLNLQVLAVIYVLSSFGTFLWGVVITGLFSGKNLAYLQGFVGEILIKEPVYAYFVIQFILVLVYLPLANKRVHRFHFSRLRKLSSRASFSLALSLAESTLFFMVFLALSLMLIVLSNTNYRVHKVLLNEPEISLTNPEQNQVRQQQQTQQQQSRSTARRISNAVPQSTSMIRNKGTLTTVSRFFRDNPEVIAISSNGRLFLGPSFFSANREESAGMMIHEAVVHQANERRPEKFGRTSQEGLQSIIDQIINKKAFHNSTK